MANEQPVTRGTLGLTGLTMNAMALIAPGAFLWLTFQMQSLYGAPMAGVSMWFGILFGTAPVSGDGNKLCRAVEALSGPRLVVPLRGAGVPVQDARVPVRPYRQVRHRLGEPPVLLGIPGRDGRRDGDPGRLPARAVVSRHLQRQITARCSCGFCGLFALASPTSRTGA